MLQGLFALVLPDSETFGSSASPNSEASEDSMDRVRRFEVSQHPCAQEMAWRKTRAVHMFRKFQETARQPPPDRKAKTRHHPNKIMRRKCQRETGATVETVTAYNFRTKGWVEFLRGWADTGRCVPSHTVGPKTQPDAPRTARTQHTTYLALFDPQLHLDPLEHKHHLLYARRHHARIGRPDVLQCVSL